MKQSSFYNTNVLLKTISMSCARARSCQTSHAINAALSIATPPSHSLLTPEPADGNWTGLSTPCCLLTSLSACSPAPLLLPAAVDVQLGTSKWQIYAPDSQPRRTLSPEMFPCTISSCPAGMLSPPEQPQAACSSFHGTQGASPCEPWGHKPYMCVCFSIC